MDVQSIREAFQEALTKRALFTGGVLARRGGSLLAVTAKSKAVLGATKKRGTRQILRESAQRFETISKIPSPAQSRARNVAQSFRRRLLHARQ